MDSDDGELEGYDYYDYDPWDADLIEDMLYHDRVDFAQEMESRLDLLGQTWTWFDIDWSEDRLYDDGVEDWVGGNMLSSAPPGCDIDPRPILHDRRWTDLKIRDRGKELCTGELQPARFTNIWHVKKFEINGQPASAKVALKDAPESHHVELARRLLLEHDSLRGIAQERSRSSLRPLTLIDLPLEVLSFVAQYLDKSTSENPKSVELPYKADGSSYIQCLRLTCQTLNHATSPALLHCVTVQMTKSSLDRLEYIAERPHLRNGVERVRISLGYFCATVAATVWNFTEYAFWMLRFALYRQDEERRSILTDISGIEDAMLRHAQLRDLLDSWKKLCTTPRDGADGEQRWLALFRQQRELVEMYEAYKRSFEEYESVQQNFVNKVANALSQMPRFTRLEVSDYLWRSRRKRTVRQDLGWALESDKNFMEGDNYRELFTKPMQWDRLAGFSPMGGDFSFETLPPVDVLGQLFPLLGRLGVQLTKVDINITSPPGFEALCPTDVEARQGIVKLLQKMWFLRFKIRPLADWRNYDRNPVDEDGVNHVWKPRSQEELVGLDTFLDALLDTKSLSLLILDFITFKNDKLQGSSAGNWYLPSIMKPRQWAQPLQVLLNAVCLDSKRLDRFIGDGPVHFRQFENIYMARGTWNEALDVMHQKYDLSAYDAPKTSFTATHMFRDLGGAEVQHMDENQQHDAFETTISCRPSSLHAYFYIKHEREDNPFRPFAQHVV
ncbi:hypothetical protein CGLO_05229 [Colletotrichum gloeosporioides Cg-14]|uniref:Uncharacterized protein n=1 Tax=Colletotrichum gloeosporioides (strain Cg-14) TaxID=1237896 RepID=T0KQI4_COLGC|nr:hypothetical protein CGLO_05229 [Colletotrichum gloeosporioides Cg-14]